MDSYLNFAVMEGEPQVFPGVVYGMVVIVLKFSLTWLRPSWSLG